MKKTTIILTLCMLASLAGCGKIDSAEESKPLNIQKATINSTKDNSDKDSESSLEESMTEWNDSEETAEIIHLTTNATFTVPVTTAKTGTAILVKRSTIPAPNIPPSRGTVRVPTASTAPKTVKTTAVATKTTGGTSVSTSTMGTNTAATTTKTTGKKTSTTTSATTAITTTTTTTAVTIPVDVTNGDITCRVQENGVAVIRDDKTVQLIEIDTQTIFDAYNSGIKDNFICLNDYDFDGYDDMYIKLDGFKNPNLYGTYMHYNPESEQFEIWEEMADINTVIWIDEENQKLNTSVKENDVNHESWTYIWNDDKQLQLIESSLQYEVENDVFADYFEYPDGEKTLVRREQLILDDEQNIIDTIEIPLEEEPTEENEE